MTSWSLVCGAGPRHFRNSFPSIPDGNYARNKKLQSEASGVNDPGASDTAPVMEYVCNFKLNLKLNTGRAISLVVKTSVTHNGVLWLDCLLCSLIPTSCCYGDEKPKTWVLPPKSETWVEFLVDVISTAQFQPLRISGVNQRMGALSLFFLLPLTKTKPF